MPQSDDQSELKRLIKSNTELIKENSTLLRKIHRYTVIGFTWKIVSVLLIIGLPFALYFYILEPYFTAFGSSYETFELGVRELPGLKGLEQFFEQFASSTEQN